MPAENLKRQPVRTCLGCRRKRERKELSRLALKNDPDGAKVISDEGQCLGGRGAWLCRDSVGCFDSALKKNAFNRAFKVSGFLDLTEIEKTFRAA